MARKIKMDIPELEESVSGLVSIPQNAFCIMVLAHGAGVGMKHHFMEALALSLENEGIATLRFNFPYMEKGKNRPDSPRVAHAAQRAALQRAAEYGSRYGIPVVAAGKSFGGRMFSQLLTTGSFGTSALVFFGFPLHAPGKPGTNRADHLRDVTVPMLFLQGTRDTLATPDLIKEVSKGLRKGTMKMFEGADHGFQMLKRSGVTDEEMISRLATETQKWLRKKL